MKFLVDLPLQGLAKWLRFCGLAAECRAFSGPGSLPAPEPGVFLLTRQARHRHLKREDVLVLTANEPEQQLAEVFRRLGIRWRDLAPLSRCGECNEPLKPVSREEIRGLVPEHVFFSQSEFFHCSRCHRVYWPGSHPGRIAATLREVFRQTRGPRATAVSPSPRSKS